MNVHRLILGFLGVCLLLGSVELGLVNAVTGHKKVHLSFWNGWTGPDGRVMLEMIRDFNKENPDVEVDMQRLAWALYYNKLMVSAMDRRGPEIFVVHASTLPRMVRAGFLADESGLFDGPDGIPASDFDPYVYQQTVFDGHPVALPLDIHPQGMYCNAELLKAAGFTNPDGSARAPRTREEFLTAAHAMAKSVSGNPELFGFALTNWQNNFQSLMPQFDGRYLDEKGNADLANPGNVKALEFIESLNRKEHLIPPPDNQLGWTGFRQHKVAMVWDGVFMLGDLKRIEGLDYIGAPIPVIGNHMGTMADSHCLCTRSDLNPEQREAAFRFIRYLSKHSILWADAGQVPARISVRNTPEFRALPVQSAFAKQIPFMLYPPRIPTLFEVGTEIGQAVERVVRGHQGAKAALEEANRNAQKIIERDRSERALDAPKVAAIVGGKS